MQSNRTPGRWIATNSHNNGIWWIDTVRGDGGQIATVWGVDERGQQNAEAIVHAVNCYDTLYAAICRVHSFIVANGYDKADATLAKDISDAIAWAEDRPPQ